MTTADRQAFTARYLRHLLPTQLKGTPTGELLVQLKSAAAARGLVVLRYETKGASRYDLEITYALHPAADPEPATAQEFTGNLKTVLKGLEGATPRSAGYKALHQLLHKLEAI